MPQNMRGGKTPAIVDGTVIFFLEVFEELKILFQRLSYESAHFAISEFLGKKQIHPRFCRTI